MNYRLDHVAISCKNLDDSIRFYENYFGGKASEIRNGAAGYRFCFVQIDGSAPIQLMESTGDPGLHHYGFVTDDIETVAADFKRKGAQIIRKNHDKSGKLTTIFVKDSNGLQLEIRLPR